MNTIGFVSDPFATMRPSCVTISVPGVPTVEPGDTAAVRGWPRTIVPGAIVNVAPLRTKIGFCITITPVHVVFAVTSAATTVCAPASAARPARATITAAKSVFRIFDWLFSSWG